MKLSQAKVGECVVVKRIDLPSELVCYAESRGLYVGNILRILDCYKSRVLVEVDQSVFMLPQIWGHNVEVVKV